MPNVGKPSRDCHLCRKRRVKCDLGRPSCQRCIKYKAECPGYRDEQDVLFRNAGPANLGPTKSKAKRNAIKASKAPQDGPSWAVGDGKGQGTFSTTLVHRGSSPVEDVEDVPRTSPPWEASHAAVSPFPVYWVQASPPRELRESWTSHSVPSLLTCYSSVQFLPNFYRYVRSDSEPFALATHLWYRAYMTNMYPAPQDIKETTQLLSRTLNSVAGAMQDPRQSKSNTTILAVWLLGMYEIQIGGLNTQNMSPSAWFVHSSGLLSIIQARGTEYLNHPEDKDAFWLALTVVLIKCMMAGQPSPPECEEWLDHIQSQGNPIEAVQLTINRYISRACTLVATITRMIVGGYFEEASASYIQLVSAITTLDRNMDEWTATIIPELFYFFPTNGYFWNGARAAKMKMHHSLIMLCNIIEHGPAAPPVALPLIQQRRETCYEVVATASQGIVDSIPVSLGGTATEFDTDPHEGWDQGIRLIYALSAVFTMRTVPKHLRLIAKCALVNISQTRGVLQAIKNDPGLIKYVPEATFGIPVDLDVETFNLGWFQQK